MENDLYYWKSRSLDARLENENDSTPQTVEELAFARCMVAVVESDVFNLEGKK